MITMPPRHGKSLFASCFFPAWYLATFPDRRVILASYEASFASSWGRKARDLMERVGKRLFDLQIRSDSKAADHWDLLDHAGGMQTCGIGGALTGKGADLLIIDDPVKNAEEANSITMREKTWTWYTSTAYTRLEPGGALIIIQTRWHEDDLSGRILQQAKESGEKWDILNLPAIAEDGDILGRTVGEALWPERFDVLALETKKRVLGSYQFAALFQQRPAPAEGGLFKKSWFRYWTGDKEFFRLENSVVRRVHCRRFGTADLAESTKKEADYTVICAWAVTRECDLILLDIHREHLSGPALVPSLKRMYDLHDLDYMGIEKNLGHSLLTHEVRMKGLTVRSLIADVDKVTRSIPAQIRMEAGQIYMPAGHAELEAIERELLTFPHGTHDDIVDNFGYAASEVGRFGGAAEPEESIKIREEQEAVAKREEAIARQRSRHVDPFDDHWYNHG
jgi:predicted phage terminase large subunit-like protein